MWQIVIIYNDDYNLSMLIHIVKFKLSSSIFAEEVLRMVQLVYLANVICIKKGNKMWNFQFFQEFLDPYFQCYSS